MIQSQNHIQPLKLASIKTQSHRRPCNNCLTIRRIMNLILRMKSTIFRAPTYRVASCLSRCRISGTVLTLISIIIIGFQHGRVNNIMGKTLPILTIMSPLQGLVWTANILIITRRGIHTFRCTTTRRSFQNVADQLTCTRATTQELITGSASRTRRLLP